MHIPLLPDIVIILGLSVPVLFFFRKLRLPTILGFLITGMIAGPNGLGLVHGVEEVEMLAEIGVIFLLFIIGLEFSLNTLAAIQRIVFIGGSIQVGLTVGVVFLAAFASGYAWNQALFLGFMLALSSTAIVLTVLRERGSVNSPQGRIALAILIFQDIIVVPMMLFAPLLAGQAKDPWMTLISLLIKAITVVALVFIGARYFVPRLLHEIARTQSRELFLLSVTAICFVVAWGTSTMGLSLALGAFMAGLVISESEYNYQATALMLPFRELFTSFFFVSIGMLLDLGFFVTHLPVILLLAIAAMLVKMIVAVLAPIVLRYPLRTALLVGFSLFQTGEFAFILSATGLEYDLLEDSTYQYFLAVSVLSMAVTPFIMQYSEGWVGFMLHGNPLPERLQLFKQLSDHPEQEPREEDLQDHVIIIGYGVTGSNVARAARHATIPYVVLDLDPSRVAQAREDGHPATYGDATQDHVLNHIHAYNARVAVVAINDVPAARMITSRIRINSNTVYLIVRTRMVREVDEFYRMGANEVIPEEFETSVEVFTRLLHRYFVPENDIEAFVREIRAGNYEMLRLGSGNMRNLAALLSIPDVNVTCLRVQQPNHQIVGKSLSESNLRARYGINLLAIQRNDQFITDIRPDTEIHQDDILYLVGQPEDIGAFHRELRV